MGGHRASAGLIIRPEMEAFSFYRLIMCPLRNCGNYFDGRISPERQRGGVVPNFVSQLLRDYRWKLFARRRAEDYQIAYRQAETLQQTAIAASARDQAL